jgi:hypothetical protein
LPRGYHHDDGRKVELAIATIGHAERGGTGDGKVREERTRGGTGREGGRQTNRFVMVPRRNEIEEVCSLPHLLLIEAVGVKV